VKIGLSGDTTIELAMELISADSACQIDSEGLGQGHHLIVPRHHFGISDVLDGPKFKKRIIVQEFIEPARTDTEAGDDLAVMHSLMTHGDPPLLDEILNRIGNHVRVDAKVSAVMQMLKRLIGN